MDIRFLPWRRIEDEPGDGPVGQIAQILSLFGRGLVVLPVGDVVPQAGRAVEQVAQVRALPGGSPERVAGVRGGCQQGGCQHGAERRQEPGGRARDLVVRLPLDAGRQRAGQPQRLARLRQAVGEHVRAGRGAAQHVELE